MKKILLAVILAFTAVSLLAQTKPANEIAPGVYYYFGDELQHRPANAVWIIFKDYVVVVDANYPWGARDILQEIRKTTAKPVRFVFNTHYHHDHSFGNSVFADSGATIVSTNETASEMKTLGRREWDQNYSGQNLEGYRQEFPTLLFDKLLVFDDGEHLVELMKMGPAHTAGDAVAWLPKEKILVTGDLCVNGNPWGNNVADPNADYDRWLNVLDTLAAMNVQTVVPGHGEPGTIGILKQQRAYLADLLCQVRQGILAGKSKEELVKEIDLSKHPVYGENKVSTARSLGAMFDKLTKQ
jgi:cyclase